MLAIYVVKHDILSKIGRLVKERKTQIVSTTFKILPKRKMVVSYIFIHTYIHKNMKFITQTQKQAQHVFLYDLASESSTFDHTNNQNDFSSILKHPWLVTSYNLTVQHWILTTLAISTFDLSINCLSYTFYSIK